MGARSTARLSDAARQAVGTRARGLCEGRYTQRGLATKTGLGIGTVRELLAGSSDPTLGTLLAVAKALELGSIEQLLGPSGTETLLALQEQAENNAAVA